MLWLRPGPAGYINSGRPAIHERPKRGLGFPQDAGMLREIPKHTIKEYCL